MPDVKDRFNDFEGREGLKSSINRELKTLDIMLTARAGRTALTLEEYIKVRQLQGATLAVIKADLLLDLQQGGRMFGEFRSTVKATFHGSVHRFRDDAVSATIGTKRQQYRWVAVLVNTCPDCISRHGTHRLWSEWEQIGLPRTGSTVCKDNCKCVLIPNEATQLEPIQRGK